MPVTRYRLKWPDGGEMRCHSPSSIVASHFEAGAAYLLPDFLRRLRVATAAASERVRAKYGFACTAAADQLAAIEAHAARFDAVPAAQVTVIDFETE